MVIFLNPPTFPWLGFLWKSGGGPDAEGLTPVGAWLLCDSLSCLPTFMVRNSWVGPAIQHLGVVNIPGGWSGTPPGLVAVQPIVSKFHLVRPGPTLDSLRPSV